MSEPIPQSNEQVLDARGVAQTLERLATDIARQFADANHLSLIGIRRRGDVLAQRLQADLGARLGREVPYGSLDITLYRDDFNSLSEQPIVGTSEIAFPLDGSTVILVDDVLFTGRTIRAALDEILELGRPARILLAVLIDRGWRELPIGPDLVGHRLDTDREDTVQVFLTETDGRDEVIITRRGQGSA